MSNKKRSSGVITGGFGDDFTDCLLDADDLFGKNIPFDTFSYINSNNICMQWHKAEIMQDMDTKDEVYPNDDVFFGDQP